MKWVYGKQDWKTLERGQENCYLMTNGLGGFSSLTMTGSAARNDHAFLMACTHAPNHRYNMVHRLSEQITELSSDREVSWMLSSQEFADGSCEEGYRALSEFSYEDTPVWLFQNRGVQVEKEAVLVQGENTAAVCYRIENRSGRAVRLSVTPFFQFVPKGMEAEEDQVFERSGNRITSRGLSLDLFTNGSLEDTGEMMENCFYAWDVCDGRRATGRAKALVRICADVNSGEKKSMAVIFRMPDESPAKEAPEKSGAWEMSSAEAASAAASAYETDRDIVRWAEDMIAERKAYRKKLEREADFHSEMASFLAKSAEQFISLRESTGGETILAGFPFFEDWGRDTMIALPGVCISTRRFENAASILRTFARYEKDGLMPNLFPEGENEPRYNTADAALLFINCVWLYCGAAEDESFAVEMYPVMERIIDGYRNGTGFGIHMDDDGLMMAGEDLDQVTWMDVRVGEILPTPRHGKPVEINAYWYNALCIMERFAGIAGKQGKAEEYHAMAEQVKTSFCEKFWNPEKHCLKDVLSGTKADDQIRCNQIWAVSMPFTMLEREQEKQIVDTVFEKLYTPYGLRTLDPEDPEFCGFYGGEMLERDLAYHQGTTWTYPLGGYYLAYLKVNDYNEEAVRCVRRQVEVLESAMREGCIGQLPEIYDGENPVSSKGCFAQAWSVGEMLRVYEALERGKKDR